MENTDITQHSIINQTDPVVQKKRQQWGDLGEAAHNLDLKLQAMAQAAIKKINIPKDISEVPAAELVAKELRKDKVAIETERKLITSRLDFISEKLMKSEKLLPGHIETLENAIILIKKADKEKKEKQGKIDADTIKCREYLATYKNNTIAGFNTKILTAVDAAYSYALGAGNVTKEGLPEFITKALTKFKAADFCISSPKNTFQHVDNVTFSHLVHDILADDPAKYLTDYENKLRLKFADYEIALANKVAALELSKTETAAATQKVAEIATNNNVAAKLEAVAVTPAVISGTKPLRSAWEIDMEETLENSVLIMTAFVGNIHLTKEHLRVTKWNAFTVGQMGNALAKCKTVDPAFEATGIVFKSIDKL